jgi:hypothetical protein
MITPDQEPTPGTREHFLEVTTLRRWGTIQEYVELCRAHGYFTPSFYAKATVYMERIDVRRMLRQVTDGRGWHDPCQHCARGPQRPPEHVFMQEEFPGPEE